MAVRSDRQRILIAHTGGLGDLVLLANVIASLKKARPESHLTVACRAEFQGVTKLFPIPADEIVPLDFDPYRWSAPSAELLQELRPVVERLQSRSVDLYVSAEMQPTWLGWLLASVFQPPAALCCTRTEEPAGFLVPLRQAFGLPPWPMERIALPEGTHELRRYELLLNALSVPLQRLAWNKAPRVRSGEYLVCFPSGSPGTAVKRWPLEHFAETLRAWKAQWNLPVVLLGDAGEGAELRNLADQIGATDVMAGAPISEAAALLAHARVYLGNDTGTMHLAAAFGVPGVAIYGGGHWPAYAPWGAGSIGLVNPLPCFGCDWDCVFGRGVCVEIVPVEEVLRALAQVMREPGEPECRVLSAADPKLVEIAGSASMKHRSLLQEFHREIKVREERIANLEATAAERLSAMLDRDREIQIREQRIAILQTAADERLAAMQHWDREIRVREERIAALQIVAEQRLAALRSKDI